MATATVLDLDGNELDRGWFYFNAQSPQRPDGSYDRGYRLCVAFDEKVVTAADYGLPEVRVVIEGIRGDGSPQQIQYKVRGDEESRAEARRRSLIEEPGARGQGHTRHQCGATWKRGSKPSCECEGSGISSKSAGSNDNGQTKP